MNPDVPRSPKPHPMAVPAGEPCPRCGYDWFRPMVIRVEDADELPIVAACARCKWYPTEEEGQAA